MDAAALAEKWREVVDSPYLRDLPFKLELNEDGKVEFAMSPATNRHSLLQGIRKCTVPRGGGRSRRLESR